MSQDTATSTQSTQVPNELPTQVPTPVSSKSTSILSSPTAKASSQPPSRSVSRSPTIPSGDCERSKRKSSGDSSGLFPDDPVVDETHLDAGNAANSMNDSPAHQTQRNKTLCGHDSLLDDSFDISLNQSSSEVSLNQSSSSYASSTSTLVPDESHQVDEPSSEKAKPDISCLKFKASPPPKNENVDKLFERPQHEYYFDELDLLKRFAEFIQDEDPDIILVWNRDASIGTGFTITAHRS